MHSKQPIGIFDSGLGGLTVYKAIKQLLPQYDFIYLGDNARAPYGNRSFEKVYAYTWECVQWLYHQKCPLVILACNTASAKALRSIQQYKLPQLNPHFRTLGVIRPTAEVLGTYTTTKKVGILATQGTVLSNSYPIELHKFFPELSVFQQACPLWVPFIETGAYQDDAVDYYIKKDVDALMAQNAAIDTVLMACTHYPLIAPKIKKYLPKEVCLLGQGEIVAQSLLHYLQRHLGLAAEISTGGNTQFFTTDDPAIFDAGARIFMADHVASKQITL